MLSGAPPFFLAIGIIAIFAGAVKTGLAFCAIGILIILGVWGLTLAGFLPKEFGK